jgi:hypothetical protein
MNKAATQYVKSILARCAAEEGIATVDLHGYAFHTDFPYLDHLSAEEMEGYQHIFKPKGYLYSVFGGMIEGLPDLEDYLTVLMVRDPRDVLVSKYYSIAYSHSEPDKSGNKYEEFMSQRAYAREVSIDEYVLSERDTVYSVYQRYRDLLVERFSHYYCTRYEEMIADFSDWLGALLNYCQFDVSDELFDLLVEEHEAKIPKKEDVNKHLRKGIAGDYKNKLESRTIEILNAQFEEVLKGFGYAF